MDYELEGEAGPEIVFPLNKLNNFFFRRLKKQKEKTVPDSVEKTYVEPKGFEFIDHRSIRRLSDGEIFSEGDYLSYRIIGYYKKTPIYNFDQQIVTLCKSYDGELQVKVSVIGSHDYIDTWGVEKLKHAKLPD